MKTKPLLIGCVLSLLCTLAAYAIAFQKISLMLVVGLGFLQTAIQLLCFFGIGRDRWNFLMFLFMILVVFIIIGGSVWIMYNLNYHMMG